MKNSKWTWAALAALLVGGGIVRSVARRAPEPARPAALSPEAAKKICVLHHCAMAHCEMELTVEPGGKATCPICGVSEEVVASTGTILYYRNPMNPAVTSPVPRKDEMGMEYIPVYAEEGAGSSVPGRGNLELSAERRQMIGMKSEAVARRDLSVVVRAAGKVAYDPELYQAIAEYREAVKARDAVARSSWPDVRERSAALARAAELRLRQLGLSEGQIGVLMKSESSATNLLFAGDGGTVWVYAQIYEYEIGLVKPGQRADVTASAYPGRIFRGTVKAVDPILSAETRSLRARIEVPNPGGALKLEMFVDAAIRADAGRGLALPAGAVIDTGVRKIVFVDLGEGRIEPREVTLGREADGYDEVLSGVREGEKVVTAANFLIDSESKLHAVAPAAR
jgi:Cu(I)/Ag(I) efflux system membrane fusion protein